MRGRLGSGAAPEASHGCFGWIGWKRAGQAARGRPARPAPYPRTVAKNLESERRSAALLSSSDSSDPSVACSVSCCSCSYDHGPLPPAAAHEESRHRPPERPLPEALRRLPVPGDRPAGVRVHRGEPRRGGHQAGHRRRHRAAAGGVPRGHEVGRGRPGEKASFRGYGPEQGYGSGSGRRSRSTTSSTRLRRLARRDLRERRQQVQLRQRAGRPRPRQSHRGDRSRLPGLRRHERDGRQHRARTGRRRLRGHHVPPADEENGFEAEIPTEKVDVVYLCFPNNPTGAVATKERLRSGSTTRTSTTRSSSSTPPTRPSCRTTRCRGASTRSPAPRRAPSSSAASPRTPASPAPAAPSPSAPRASWPPTPTATSTPSTSCGTAARAPNSTASATSCSAPPRPCTATPAASSAPGSCPSTWRTPDILKEKLGAAGIAVHGGVHAPYLWLETPGGVPSWDFFDKLLSEAHVVGTPGAGFGSAGEGYFRLSAFNSRENVEEAICADPEDVTR